MKAMLRAMTLAAAGACLPTVLAQETPPTADPIRVIYEAPPAHAPNVLVPPTPTPLSLGLEAAFADSSNFVELLPVTFEEIDAADRELAERYRDIHPGPERIGIVRSPDSELVIDASVARATPLDDGRTLWTLAVTSPTACGLRLFIDEFDVGDGQMVIYSPDVDGLVVRGPFTSVGPNGSGEFWTASLPGDTAFIEVAGHAPPQFRVAQLVHFDRLPGGDSTERTRCNPGTTLNCHIDVMCRSVDECARQATGQMNFIVGASCAVCTGTLLNDYDGETVVPHFLTAWHCISDQAQVNTLEVAFNYQTAFCGDPTTPNWNSASRVVGGTLLASADIEGGNDMSFIRLAAMPGNACLAGWTTLTGGGSYGIHHPAGSWKRFYAITDVGVCPGCETCPWDSDEFDFYDMLDGIMQGGSSGSGAFTGDGRLCGTLTGQCCIVVGCGDPDAECTNRDDFVVGYGEFEQTFPLIYRWLLIGGTINVNRAYNGPEFGTPAEPFNTFVEGFNFAWNGTRVRLVANNYPETGVFNKQVTLLATGGPVVIGQ